MRNMNKRKVNVLVQTADGKVYKYDDFIKTTFEVDISKNEFLTDETMQAFAPEVMVKRTYNHRNYELTKDRAVRLQEEINEVLNKKL